MPRKKSLDHKPTKVVGLRVPIDKAEEIKKPLRNFANYYLETGKTIEELLENQKNNNIEGLYES